MTIRRCDYGLDMPSKATWSGLQCPFSVDMSLQHNDNHEAFGGESKLHSTAKMAKVFPFITEHFVAPSNVEPMILVFTIIS